ncbi:hypothetical protein BD769DRAFT_1673823 [Suillus cothurnatus]|nr:hypothetical protein BD769DRAFT_1673823 [Suillus cothurnatus]
MNEEAYRDGSDEKCECMGYDKEKHFLMDLKDEPVEHILACSYVQALIDLQSADQKWQKMLDLFCNTSHAYATNYKENTQQTSQLEAKRRAALDGMMVHIRAVADLEERLGIKERWTPQHPEYLSAFERIKSRDFRRALDKLQQLVVHVAAQLSRRAKSTNILVYTCSSSATDVR